MLSRIVIVVTAAVLVAGCQSGVKTTDLTEDDQKKLKLVAQENVASFGAPPMVPAEHKFEIGSDIYSYENGGESCLDCHEDDSDEDVPQTSHPERHNCLQCHLPQRDDSATAADFQVDNVFTKYDPGKTK
jgi:nitrate reductase cytochrome c-type subunit